MAELPIETVRHMLRSGLGAAFVTYASMAAEIQTGAVVEVEVEDLPPGYRDSALVCLKKNLPLNTMLRDFVQEIKIQARGILA